MTVISKIVFEMAEVFGVPERSPLRPPGGTVRESGSGSVPPGGLDGYAVQLLAPWIVIQIQTIII